jgi:hypothetical protein
MKGKVTNNLKKNKKERGKRLNMGRGEGNKKLFVQ